MNASITSLRAAGDASSIDTRQLPPWDGPIGFGGLEESTAAACAKAPLTYTHADLGKASRKRDRRKKTPGYVTALKWAAGLSVVALMIYAAWDMAGVVYNADDIAVVDFSDLPSSSRRTALQAANRARCNCGCGMTLAQCVATDSTCPVRETNIERIRTLVRDARNTS
jgi:hypothetical protein